MDFQWEKFMAAWKNMTGDAENDHGAPFFLDDPGESWWSAPVVFGVVRIHRRSKFCMSIQFCIDEYAG